jgi:hypothetical protein
LFQLRDFLLPYFAARIYMGEPERFEGYGKLEGTDICWSFPNVRSTVRMEHTLQPRYTYYELSGKRHERYNRGSKNRNQLSLEQIK